MNNKKLKNAIIKLLKSEKIYEGTDLVLIDELLYHLDLIDQAKKDVRERGINVNLRKSDQEPFYQLNNSLSIIQKSTKIVQDLYKQLGLDVITRLTRRDKKEKLNSKDASKNDAIKNLRELINED